MPEDAVMDAAVDTALDTDVGAETEVQTEPVVSEGEGEQPEKPVIEAPVKPLIDGGKLSAEAKETLEKLKAENPALAKSIQRALFKEAEYAKALPGGLKDVQALRDTIEQLGGDTGIQEMRAEISGWQQFDQQYTAGDPKAIEFMTSEPEGQAAFLKLIPSALQKYEQLHPDGYSQYMAQVFSHTIGEAGIPLALERLSDFIGDNPKAQEQYTKIVGFINGILGLSRKAVEAPKIQQATQPDTERAKFEQERTSFERTKWKDETAAKQRPAFEAEWTRLAGGRKISNEQRDAIYELYESRLNRAINGQHKDTLERYFAAKDKNGFMRYAANLDSTEMPKALRAAFDAILPSKPGPKAGTPPAKPGQPAKNTPIAQGFVQVASQPGTHEIDYKHPFNSPANFQAGKAVLKGGRKVQWTR